MNVTYSGTDPLLDAEKIHMKHSKKLLADENNHVHVENYPFENFGLGITSYFRLITVLAQVFTLISIIAAVPIVIYSMEEGYSEEHDSGIFKKQMLGNMGEAYQVCAYRYLNYSVDSKAHCEKGYIGELLYAGIVPY